MDSLNTEKIQISKDTMIRDKTKRSPPSVRQNSAKQIKEASQLIRSKGEASIALLQRHYKLGYSAAIALMTSLEGAVVSTPDQDGRRSVLPFN